ncbi:MAG: DUF4911 domain-containing protein [Desulfamplus sp.]|nr:DUF4911 domain-containing protein [Desulfamplus sp.]
MRTIHKIFRVDKSRIGFLKFIFEAYDGIAVITTLEVTPANLNSNANTALNPDIKYGLVRFAIAPDCEEDVEAVLCDLKKDIYINEL